MQLEPLSAESVDLFSVSLTAFVVCGKDTDMEADALKNSGNVTIYAPAGSKAQIFAEDNKIPFIPLIDQPA